MTDPNDLNPEELLDYRRRYEANCRLYGLDADTAVSSGDGRIARVAAACALNDVRNRRQTIWSKR